VLFRSEVLALYSSCGFCNPVVTTTPTVTPTQTSTPTPTPGVSPTTTQTSTPTPTQTPTITATPSQTPTFGSSPTPTPSTTLTSTPTTTQTPTVSPTLSPTSTITPTPSSTPIWVYVYESCSPIGILASKKTQVIQTQSVSFPITVNQVFKDSMGNCWKYLGQFETSYIPPITVDSVNYNGNYFSTAINYAYNSCTECQTVVPLDPCTNYLYYNLQRCDNGDIIQGKACDLGSSPLTINFFELGVFGSTTSSVNFNPTVGTTLVVYSYDTNNNITDKFCATITSTSNTVTTSNILQVPLIGTTYNCNTCALYYKYQVTDCTNGGTFDLYQHYTQTQLNVGQVIGVNENTNCYTVTSQLGLVYEQYLGALLIGGTVFTYNQNYTDCNECYSIQSPPGDS
jgi:hypothetical protein